MPSVRFGSHLGYRVTPAGAQSRLGDLPLTVRAFPDGKAALVVNAGQGQQSVQVVDPGTGGVLQTIGYPAPQALFVGAAFSPDGTRAYVSAGGNNKIRTYSVSGDRLTETAPIALPTTNPAGVPVNLYPADLAPTPDGRRLVVADQVADAATVVDVVTGASRTVAVGHAPYGIAVSADGRSAYVTNQGAATVSVLDITGTAPVVRATVPVGTHPNRIVADARRHLAYVADGDADTVSRRPPRPTRSSVPSRCPPTRARRSAPTRTRWRWTATGTLCTWPTPATTTSRSSTPARDASGG